MRRLGLGALALLVLALVPAALAKAPAPAGTLTQLPGAQGCFVDPSQGASQQGCAVARGLGSTQNLVLSPDGRSAYASSNYTWGLDVLTRDPRTGVLRQAPGTAGCFTSNPLVTGCTAARGMAWAFWTALSPDGRNVYLSGGSGDAIAVLRRNRATGHLTQLAGTQGCLHNRTGGTGKNAPTAAASGCALADGLNYPRTVAVDPSGRFV